MITHTSDTPTAARRSRPNTSVSNGTMRMPPPNPGNDPKTPAAKPPTSMSSPTSISDDPRADGVAGLRRPRADGVAGLRRPRADGVAGLRLRPRSERDGSPGRHRHVGPGER